MSGNRIAMMAALAAACFTAVIAAAAQAGRQNVAVSVSDCTVPAQSFMEKCFKVTTRPASALRVNLGPALTISDSPRLVHTITVPGLKPGTSYSVSLVAIPKTGKPKTMRLASVQTAAVGSFPATARAAGHHLTVNGVPTLLYSAYIYNCWDAQTVNTDQKAGFDLIMGHACLSPSDPQSTITSLQSALGATWWHEEEKADESKLQSLPNLLAWNAAGPSPIFPAPDPCRGGGDSNLPDWFARSVAQITQSSASKVVIPTIYVSDSLAPGMANCMTPQWMNLFFWGSLATGADGLVFDTHQIVNQGSTPNFSANNPALWGQVSTELKWAAAFGPVAAAGTPLAGSATAPDGTVKRVWRYGGGWYAVFVNPTTTAAAVSAQLPKTAAALASGLFGTRSLKLSAGQLKLQMAPKSYAVYKIMTK